MTGCKEFPILNMVVVHLKETFACFFVVLRRQIEQDLVLIVRTLKETNHTCLVKSLLTLSRPYDVLNVHRKDFLITKNILGLYKE